MRSPMRRFSVDAEMFSSCAMALSLSPALNNGIKACADSCPLPSDLTFTSPSRVGTIGVAFSQTNSNNRQSASSNALRYQQGRSLRALAFQGDDRNAPVHDHHLEWQRGEGPCFLAARDVLYQRRQLARQFQMGFIGNSPPPNSSRPRSHADGSRNRHQDRCFLERQDFVASRLHHAGQYGFQLGAGVDQFQGKLLASMVGRRLGKGVREGWNDGTRLFQFPLALLDQRIDRKLWFHRDIGFGG